MGDAAKSGTSQNQTQSSNSTGSSTGSSTGTVTPWDQTNPLLSGLINQISGQVGSGAPTATENWSLGGLQDYLSGPGLSRAASLSNELADGGVDRRANTIGNYEALNTGLTPTIRGDYLDPNTNPFFAQTTSDISRNAEERFRGLYAGSGRSAPGAGNYQYNAARGIGEATAPIYAATYNTERGRQEDAKKTLFSGGQDMISSLLGQDKQILANKGAASDAATDPYNSLLAAEAYKRNIPLSTLASLVGLSTPIANLGRQTSGTTAGTTSSSSVGTGSSEGEQQASLLDSITKIGNLFKKG